jgi:predicted proteasome-type protease
MRLGEVAKLILLSFDATLRSNLSVGMPIDLLLYERDTLDVRRVPVDQSLPERLATLLKERHRVPGHPAA